MQQADDFLCESDKLHVLIAPMDAAALEDETGFKRWTISDIVRHLHVWNEAAMVSLSDEAAFGAFMAEAGKSLGGGGDLRQFERAYKSGLAGPKLVAAWHDTYVETADHFRSADPSQRVPWAGPSMSARSSITARLMESWAHGQAVFDLLGQRRENGDALRNIAILGVNTFGWTFRNRREEIPDAVPFVDLVAPSGARWTFGEERADESVSGSAEEFCQVVTQTRNIGDTGLAVSGPVATRWMEIAQCFAGAPVDPPKTGERHCAI